MLGGRGGGALITSRFRVHNAARGAGDYQFIRLQPRREQIACIINALRAGCTSINRSEKFRSLAAFNSARTHGVFDARCWQTVEFPRSPATLNTCRACLHDETCVT